MKTRDECNVSLNDEVCTNAAMTVSHLFLQNMVLVSLKKPTNVIFGTATIVLFIKMSLN